MKKHNMPRKIRTEIPWAGDTNLRVENQSKTDVPPCAGLGYAKNPKNDHNTNERKRDIYFVCQLISIYRGTVFKRGDLDAGRLNRLWCDGILIIETDATHGGDPNAEYSLNLERVFSLLRVMVDN